MTEQQAYAEAFKLFKERTASTKCPICQSSKVGYQSKENADGTHNPLYVTAEGHWRYRMECYNCFYQMEFAANEYITLIDIQNPH